MTEQSPLTTNRTSTVNVEPAIGGRTFDAVLFDMDGTLVDSTPAVERSWATWGSEYGLTRSALEAGHGQPAVAAGHLAAAPLIGLRRAWPGSRNSS